MDERYLEQASALEQARRDDAIAEAHKATSGNGQPDCHDCGEAIPPQRRAACPAAIRCVICQGAFEFVKKGTAR